MSENLEETLKKECIDLLVLKRGDERYRYWATGAVERCLARGNSPLELRNYLKGETLTLVMSGGVFFSPHVVKL